MVPIFDPENQPTRDKHKAIHVYEKLVREAAIFGCAHDIERRIQRCLRDGEEIPDHLLPGRSLNRLSDEEREALKKLKSEDIQNRRADYLI